MADEPRNEDEAPSDRLLEQERAKGSGPVTVIDLPPDFFPVETRAIRARDALLAATLPLLTLVAWCCPDRLCLWLSGAAPRLLYWLRPARYEDLLRIFADYLPGNASPGKRVDQVIEAAALHHLERLQLLRYHRPGSWRPRIEVVGKAHLEHALVRGKGAILWIAFATFSDMISKVALREQGYGVWHLSRHTHGHFSSTRFGLRYLNPIRTSLECRYLAGRVVIDPAEPKAALARLEKLLCDNQVVSVTLGAEARRVTLAPFGPGQMPLAGGAPSLAIKSGAALLPVFTQRRADGSFLVTIEPPLDIAKGLNQKEQIAHLIASEAALLYRYFERLPTQFHYQPLHRIRDRYHASLEGDAGGR